MTAKSKPKNLSKKKYEVEYESLPDDRIKYLRDQNRRKQSSGAVPTQPPREQPRKMSFDYHLLRVYNGQSQNGPFCGEQAKYPVPGQMFSGCGATLPEMSDPGCNFLGTSSSTLPSAMNGMNGRSIGPNMSQNMNGHGMNSRFQINGNGGHLNGQHSGQNGHHNAPSHVGQSRTLEDALFDDDDDLSPFMRPRGKAATFSGMTPFQHRIYQVSSSNLSMFGSEEQLANGMTEPMMAGTPEAHDFDIASPHVGGPNQPPPAATPDTIDAAGNASKKSTTRRNAWGNMSYADLITQAIMSSPEKKLTLSQVYEWMVQNVPYFRDKGDSNSSAGWKNSIRHNLSLHNRFMRIQNEGAGKSSWWVINPDAKPGRNPRRPRAATMEATSKASMEKKRRGAKKRVDMPGTIRGPGLNPGSSLVGSQASIMSHDPYGDDEPLGSFDGFRPRTQSTISISATGSRVSPSMEQATFDEFDFPPWVDNAAAQAHAQAAAPHCVNEILDRTTQISIGDNRVPDASTFPRMLNGPQALNGIKTSPTQMAQIKQEPIASTANGGIKPEMNGVQPPPSYHELDPVRGTSQLQQNPLLRTQIHTQLLGAKLTAPTPVGVGFPCFAAPMYSAIAGCPSTMLQWPASSSAASLVAQQMTCGQSAGLPTDLENLNLPDSHSLMDLDMESLLRHELELSQNEKLGFD